MPKPLASVRAVCLAARGAALLLAGAALLSACSADKRSIIVEDAASSDRNAADGPSVVDGPDARDGGADVVSDDRTPVRLVITPPIVTVTITEGSDLATFLVSLDRPHSQPITVTLASANAAVARVIPESLTFPSSEVGPEMVQVTAPVDDDTADGATTLTLSSPETGAVEIDVRVRDRDVQRLVVAPPLGLSIIEGRTAMLDLALGRRPPGAVMVTLTSSNSAKLTVGTASVMFDASNYSTPRQVSLTAVEDDDASDHSETVSIAVVGDFESLSLPVAIRDNDHLALDIQPGSLTVVERANMPGNVSVRLTAAPAAEVTVEVASSSAAVTVRPTALTFTPASFASPQTVEVSAVSDDDSRDETATITFTATELSPQAAAVIVDDTDTQSIVVSSRAFAVAEGASTTFTVRLAARPEGPTAVGLFPQNPGKLDVTPSRLDFDATNFATPQTVTVGSVHDEDLASDSVDVTLTMSGAPDVDVAVAVSDDDVQAILLVSSTGAAPLVIQEPRGLPETSQLGVRLSFRPSSETRVNLSSSNAELDVSPTSLVFSPSDYSRLQYVTLTALGDSDIANDAATVTAAAEGGPAATLSVVILDFDLPAFDHSNTGATRRPPSP